MTVTWLIGALFILMCIILFGAMIMFRAKPGARAVFERGDTKKDAVIALVFSLIIFLGVDGTLLVNSHTDVNEVFWNFPEKDPEVLKVEVLAQQWAWNFRYAGRDGKFNTPDDIVTFNDFRVPEGKKVLLQMQSKDVIHSFFLAQCRIKRDVNPGEITRLWFQTKPNTAGEYSVACAQMCGYAHYMMQGKFRVLTKAQWDAWYDEAAQWSSLAYDPAKADQHWGWEWRPGPSAQ